MTFREAVEARDMAAVEAMLADDVVFPQPGRVQAVPRARRSPRRSCAR